MRGSSVALMNEGQWNGNLRGDWRQQHNPEHTRAHVMETVEEDGDIKLARASAGLLADLESCLPKLLWKPSRDSAARGPVHSRVRQKDLDYIINLVGSIS